MIQNVGKQIMNKGKKLASTEKPNYKLLTFLAVSKA
jgi:hypothetical protein